MAIEAWFDHEGDYTLQQEIQYLFTKEDLLYSCRTNSSTKFSGDLKVSKPEFTAFLDDIVIVSAWETTGKAVYFRYKLNGDLIEVQLI